MQKEKMSLNIPIHTFKNKKFKLPVSLHVKDSNLLKREKFPHRDQITLYYWLVFWTNLETGCVNYKDPR